MKLLPREGSPEASAPEHAAATEALAPEGLVPTIIGAERIQLMGMKTAPVVVEPIGERLRTVGYLTVNEASTAIVNTRFSGYVEKVLVGRIGQFVKKGEPLVTVYSGELVTGKQVYLNANGIPDPEGTRRLSLLGLQAADIADMFKPGHLPGVTPIRAPISGFVSKRSAIPGLFFTPGIELYQIADLTTLWLVADLYERDMDRVKAGQKATLALFTTPGERYSGTVQFISPVVNAESRTLQAQIPIKNPGNRLRPGMFGDVVIDLEPVTGMVVPAEAVVDSGERQYLFVSRPAGRFEPRLVTLGVRSEGKVQVLRGVAPGELVVTTANFLVDSESRLRAAIEGFTAVPPKGSARDAPSRPAAPPSR
jgi:multidrug efflux pump subunit AcrA (membrane-fusion protein)